MSENRIYLTVADNKREPKKGSYIAVISRGQPQEGDENVDVLDVEFVGSMEEATDWFKQMLVERPWEARQ
jgi:hypothetical protein